MASMKNWLYPDIAGPFVLMEQKLLPLWKGSTEEACMDQIVEAQGMASVLSIGSGSALLLTGTESPCAIYLPSDHLNDSYIVIPIDGLYPDQSDEEQTAFFRDILSRSEESDWGPIICEFSVNEYDLALISSYDAGSDLLYGGISIGLDKGKYGVFFAQSADDESCFAFYRIRPLSIKSPRPSGFVPAKFQEDQDTSPVGSNISQESQEDFEALLLKDLKNLNLNEAMLSIQNSVRCTRWKHQTYRHWLLHPKEVDKPTYLPSYGARTLYFQLRHWNNQDDLVFMTSLALGSDSVKLTPHQRGEIFEMLNEFMDEKGFKLVKLNKDNANLYNFTSESLKSSLLAIIADSGLWKKVEVRNWFIHFFKASKVKLTTKDISVASETQKLVSQLF
jgi:hypothetical protein